MKQTTVSTISLKQEIIDTVLILICYIVTAFIGGGWPFRVLLSAGYVMALIEIYTSAYCRLRLDEKPSCFAIACTTLTLVAALVLLWTCPLSTGNYLYWIGIVTAADAFGLFFGRFFGEDKPFFSRDISPNKTNAGYLGEMIGSIMVGMIIAAYFEFPATPSTMCFLFFGFIACAIGDLIASAAKRELGIKHSSDDLLDKPILGKIESLVRSRHGFLDCLDSASFSFIFYIILLKGCP